MNRKQSYSLFAGLAVLAAIVGFWAARALDHSQVELARGTWLPTPRETGNISLTDQSGKPFTAAELRGRPTLVFFGFTHCPDVCPTTLAQLAQVKKAAPIPDLRVAFISVDPERDTPEALNRYVHAFDPEFIGLTGSEQAIGALAKNFGVAVARVELPGGDYTMDHSAAVFLLDDKARIVAVFTPPYDTHIFAADLKRAAPHLHS